MPRSPLAVCLRMALLSCGLAGCATPQERIATLENRLAAAGFAGRIADTPQRLAMLQHLPPHRLLVRTAAGRNIYLYADPLVCGCLYAGPVDAFNRYRQQMLLQPGGGQAPILLVDTDPAWSLGNWGGPWGLGIDPILH